MMIDIPEHGKFMRMANKMGPRYYNIMGNVEYPNIWTNAKTYNAFLDRLKEKWYRKGYFR